MEKQVFVCDKAQEWGKHINCLDDADLDDQEYFYNTQTLVLRPSYPAPPEGFSKSIVMRGDKSSRFADIYYKSMCGLTLRSKNEVGKHLRQYPGVEKDDFYFEIPPQYPKGDNLRAYSIFDFIMEHVYYSERMSRNRKEKKHSISN